MRVGTGHSWKQSKCRAFTLLRRANPFLSLAREKGTKERGTPLPRFPGIHARKVRVRVTGFVDRASCPDAKLTGIPAGHPAGCSSTARRCRGAPGRATRILRVLFRTARSKAPRSSALQLFSSSALQLFSSSALQLFSFSAFLLFCFSAFLLFCFSAFAAAQRRRTECGPGWPAALPGAPVRR